VIFTKECNFLSKKETEISIQIVLFSNFYESICGIEKDENGKKNNFGQIESVLG
jgi:hypothetical protein